VHEDVELLERQVLLGQIVGEAPRDEARRPLEIPPRSKAVVIA
jgi:hypothetical protein